MAKGIIDSHVHWYPKEIGTRVEEWGRARGERYWVELMGGKGSLQDWVTEEEMMEAMDEAGVEKVVLQGWYWERHETCREQNEWYLGLSKRMPGRVIPFVGVNPKYGRGVIEDLKRWRDEGARGIGEVFPEVQGFEWEDEVWYEVVEFAIESGWPVMMHVTEAVGHDYKGRREVNLKRYQELAERYPELKLILAHWGGLLGFYELNPYIRKVFKNVYYDTSASPLLYEKEVFRKVIEVVGAEKVLWGSDYPLRVYPRVQGRADFRLFVEEVRGLGLEGEELVMGGNMGRLLGW